MFPPPKTLRNSSPVCWRKNLQLKCHPKEPSPSHLPHLPQKAKREYRLALRVRAPPVPGWQQSFPAPQRSPFSCTTHFNTHKAFQKTCSLQEQSNFLFITFQWLFLLVHGIISTGVCRKIRLLDHARGQSANLNHFCTWAIYLLKQKGTWLQMSWIPAAYTSAKARPFQTPQHL